MSKQSHWGKKENTRLIFSISIEIIFKGIAHLKLTDPPDFPTTDGKKKDNC